LTTREEAAWFSRPTSDVGSGFHQVHPRDAFREMCSLNQSIRNAHFLMWISTDKRTFVFITVLKAAFRFCFSCFIMICSMIVMSASCSGWTEVVQESDES